MSEARFLACGERGGDRRDLGVGWRTDDGERGRVTWIQASGEIYFADAHDHVEVLGEIEPWDLVWAIVRSRPIGEWRVTWLRDAIDAAPRDPSGVDAFVTDFRRRRDEETARQRGARRRNFEVVALASLPDVDAPWRLDVDAPWRQGDYEGADWMAIAAAAVAALSDGVDPLDTSAIGRHAADSLNERDALWLYWLFADPVVVYRDRSWFVNGMHRTWHMRRAGVTHSVIEFD